MEVNFPIALIHDSVLCRATDMCKLSSLVRKTYMRLFAEHEPLTDFALSIAAEEQPPIIGDLKPEAVIDSTILFLLMRNIHVTPEPVTLEGFQAVLKPSKFGYSLKAIVGEDLISKLETERDDCLKG